MGKIIEVSEIFRSLQRKAKASSLEIWLNSLVNSETLQEENPFYGYIPVRLVALIEDSLRNEYALIIDNKKYRKNLTKCFGRNIPLNVELLSELQDDTITIGEYFSYSFSCNGINDIIRNFKNLLDCDFSEELSKELGEQKAFLFATIQKIFEDRHALCHESSIGKNYDRNTIKSYIEAVTTFQEAIRKIVQNKINPKLALTTVDMIIAAEAEFIDVEKELNELIEILREKDSDGMIPDIGNLNFIEYWRDYREKRAEVEAKQNEEGTLRPIIYTFSKINTTHWMIKELRETYKDTLRNNNCE